MTTPDVPAERGRDELRERIEARIAELDEIHEFDEPYDGAGYCVCDDCQKEHPLLRDMLAFLLAPQEAPTRDQVMPGVFECAKCGCVVQSQTMSVLDGGVVANTEPQRCPNECGPLWPLTYKRAYQTLLDRFPEPAAPQEAREGEAEWIADYSRLLTAYKGAVIEYYGQPSGAGFDTVEAAEKMRAARHALDAHVLAAAIVEE